VGAGGTQTVDVLVVLVLVEVGAVMVGGAAVVKELASQSRL
jgi:hypothetical protein